MAGKSFSASLSENVRKVKQNMKYVAVNAIQDVVEAAQTPQRGVTKGAPGFEVGKIPVAEAELINSLVSNGVPGETSYVVALAGYSLGDYMEFAWTAAHAIPMELGFETKSGGWVPGRFYVGHNAENFSEFVKAREAEVS